MSKAKLKITPLPPRRKRRMPWMSGFLLVLICGVLVWGAAAVGEQAGKASDAAPARVTKAAIATVTETPLAEASTTVSATITETMMSRATERPRGYVEKDDYGEAWPLTVDSGVVECRPGDQIVFIHDGVTYAVNGLARGRMEENGYADVRLIWRDDPSGLQPKVSIAPLILLGLELCQGAQSKAAPAAAVCNGVDDLNCDDFGSSAAAGAHLAQCGDEDRLDQDGDGRACESL